MFRATAEHDDRLYAFRDYTAEAAWRGDGRVVMEARLASTPGGL